MAPYPHLTDFLAAWFHQDFDLAGPTLEAVVDSYALGAPPAARAALCDDIQRFLHEEAAALDARFMQAFEPEIDPHVLAAGPRDFLQRIAARVAAAPPAT